MADILYLPTAKRACENCTCTKAVHSEVMRRDPARYFFITTEACGRCGDMIEIDNSALGSAPPSADECMGCGATENLVVAEFSVPTPVGPRPLRGCICEECIDRHDDRAEGNAGGVHGAASPY